MGKNVELSLRLLAIAEMVTAGNRLADVGCDHGYLPVYLVQTGKIPGAIAMDIRRGPLERAGAHIREYGLGQYIETRLSDGLTELRRGEADTLVIAGMGGPLMIRILEKGAGILDSFNELILEPQSDVPAFREFLLKNDFQIIQEKLILEDGKFYPVMKALPGAGTNENWTREELMFGRSLLEKRDPVLRRYLDRELRIRKEILDKLKKGGAGVQKRRTEVEEEISLILSARKRYEAGAAD